MYHKLTWRQKTSFAFLFLFLFVIFFSRLFISYDPLEVHAENVLNGPSSQYLMGTDHLGRDLLSRFIYGAKITFIIGFISTFISLILGTLYGAISGLTKWDFLMMRAVDILDSIPLVVLMIFLKLFFEKVFDFVGFELRAVMSTSLALSFVSWIPIARVVRNKVLELSSVEFINQAIVMGSTKWEVFFNHINPNLKDVLGIMLLVQLPQCVMFESFLSFVGLGVQPPYSSWGILIADGVDYLESYPHLIFFPGLMLVLTMLALNSLSQRDISH